VRSSSLSLSLAFVDPCGFGGDPGGRYGYTYISLTHCLLCFSTFPDTLPTRFAMVKRYEEII
jgi:hypothetical protein